MTVFENIFRNDRGFVSVDHLRRLCLRCDKGEYDNQFLGGKVISLVIDDFDADVFVNIFTERPQTTLKRASEKMCEDHYGAIYGVPSISSFGRLLKKMRISRKVMERVHYLRCPTKRGIFMRTASPFEAFRFLDIDETQSYKEFFQKYSCAPTDQVALETPF